MSGDAFCEGTDDIAVAHLLQLGVECSGSDGDFTTYNDYLFECGSDNIHDVEEGKFTCVASAVFSSSNREETPTGVARVATDFRWAAGTLDICYTRTAGSPTSPTSPTQPSSPTGPTSPTGPSSPTGEIDPTPAPAPAPTSPTSGNEPTAPSEPDVEPVPGTTYSAEYQARIKRVIDEGCEGPSTDTVYIACPKGKLELLEVDDFLICLPVTETTDGEGEFTICETTCRGDACDDSYVDRNVFWILATWVMDEDLYAEISYSCSAEDDVNGVDSLYGVLGSEFTEEEGSCTGLGNGDGKNFLLGELNVMCDTPEGRVAVNNHAYVECDFGQDRDINDAYVCFDGRVCEDTACAVTFDDLYVYADHHRFRECIMTDNGSGVPMPEVSVELDEPVAPGQYSAQFRVGSGYWYDEDNCSGSLTGIKIECVDGTISLIEGSEDKSCSVTSESTIECIEETSLVNEHVDVAVYVSLPVYV